MINIIELHELVNEATNKQLREILVTVFEEDFNYPDENLAGSIMGSLHMMESGANQKELEFYYDSILKILKPTNKMKKEKLLKEYKMHMKNYTVLVEGTLSKEQLEINEKLEPILKELDFKISSL